jgi:mono/diheme cytochrome c family protein
MKRKWMRVLGYTAAGLALAIGGSVGYLYARKPAAVAPLAIRVAITPERIARGKRIFTIANCDGCHSERDFTRFGGPVTGSGRGKGFIFPKALGLPGTVVAPNITTDRETGIGGWTDGEKIRAIREGVDKDGKALFPLMPYGQFRAMTDEDVYSLVAYLDTLPPVRNALPKTRLDFPVNVLIKSAPQPAGHVAEADLSTAARRGEYLVRLADCVGCHTRREKGAQFAGGEEFNLGAGLRVVSANISPDAETGIGRWSESYFLERFYQYREYVEKGSPKTGSDNFTVMPWLNFAQLSPEDLKAIYAFLKTRTPVYNAVETHPTVLQAAGGR